MKVIQPGDIYMREPHNQDLISYALANPDELEFPLIRMLARFGAFRIAHTSTHAIILCIGALTLMTESYPVFVCYWLLFTLALLAYPLFILGHVGYNIARELECVFVIGWLVDKYLGDLWLWVAAHGNLLAVLPGTGLLGALAYFHPQAAQAVVFAAGLVVFVRQNVPQARAAWVHYQQSKEAERSHACNPYWCSCTYGLLGYIVESVLAAGRCVADRLRPHQS